MVSIWKANRFRVKQKRCSELWWRTYMNLASLSLLDALPGTQHIQTIISKLPFIINYISSPLTGLLINKVLQNFSDDKKPEHLCLSVLPSQFNAPLENTAQMFHDIQKNFHFPKTRAIGWRSVLCNSLGQKVRSLKPTWINRPESG